MNPLRPEEVFHFWPRMVQKAADQASLAFSSFVETSSQAASSPFSPFSMGKLFSEAMEHLAQNPATAVKAQESLASEFYDLWIHTLEQMQTGHIASIIEPEKTDKRFSHPKWDEDPFFNFIKQSYLLTSKWLLFIAENVPELDEKQRHKVSFYTKQILDAVSPSNFPLTNPKVIEKIIETKGENLVKGFENFMGDLKRGNGQLAISMTQPDAFELGVDLATTPGKVVFQNPLLQLIQYHPTTEKVLKAPLLIIPPWINKYYIFDLRSKNSFVKWAVDQGHTVFMISWVNPDKSLAKKTFEDYMLEGLGQALSVVREITSEPKVNLIGYCLGGNLLACFLSYLASKRRDEVLTATYLATLIDFFRAGDLSVFIDEEQLRTLESKMAEKGYLDGRSMAATFNLLRANDLIWSFFINNYLLGQEPFPLDFLYWNADSTRMPAAMHSYYLRNMFQKNLLRRPGGLNLGGVPIDLRHIKVPSFIIATREDHIAPWRCCYAGSQLYRGHKEFVLATSGHVAGVINPADSGKYSYLTNPNIERNPLEWLKKAKETQGSWWPYWQRWVQRYVRETVPSRKINHPKFPGLEDAPGSYVRVKG